MELVTKTLFFDTQIPLADPPPPAPILPATPPLDPSPALIYLAALGPQSQRIMRSALKTLAQLLGYAEVASCPWSHLRYQHTMAIRTQLQSRYAPATANRFLTALRRVLAEAERLGQIDHAAYRQAVDLRPVPGSRLPPGRALSVDELGALFATLSRDCSPLGARDTALLAVLLGAGLRRSEVVALDLADYGSGSGTLRVRHGKGDKERLVYAVGTAAAALDRYLTIRGRTPGPLFYAADRGGHLHPHRLTDQAIRMILRRRAAAAQIAPCTPHDLRRTMISTLLDAGVDLATVQQLAGHADPATTARYDRRGEAAKRRAAERFQLPIVFPQSHADDQDSDR